MKKLFLVFICWVAILNNADAQINLLKEAQDLCVLKKYSEAYKIYEQIIQYQPSNYQALKAYWKNLVQQNKVVKADSVIQNQIEKHPEELTALIEKGNLQKYLGKEKKAIKTWKSVISKINNEEPITLRVAESFIADSNILFAIATYEKFREINNNLNVFYKPLALLYAQNMEIEKATNTLLNASPETNTEVEECKSMLLSIIGNDEAKLKKVQAVIQKLVNKETENNYWSQILSWISIQKNDWETALVQLINEPNENQEADQRIIEFSRLAAQNGNYLTAEKALTTIINKQKSTPFYAAAFSELLTLKFNEIKEDSVVNLGKVQILQNLYDTFLHQFPSRLLSNTLADYAALEAQYHQNVPHAIALLQTAIQSNDIKKQLAGNLKLQLADVEIVQGNIWEASLLYSQVDKAFKEDFLGEDARFRNAKLAYYRGDFEWAQTQLSVLKASTSELIANDALNLSVLITENIPSDSNLIPLKRFAYADLLVFQNNYAAAEMLLDSLNQNFPKHPLNDDILMMRAQIEIKQHHFEKALSVLNQIYTGYSKDVLADDALFKMAEINENTLHKIPEAKQLYEQLILDYPGSTYVQTARNKLERLEKAAIKL